MTAAIDMTRTSSPGERRTKNRRATHRQWWQDPDWKALVKRETAGKTCEECGLMEGDIRTNTKGKSHLVHLTLDHPDRWAYASFETYIAANTQKNVVCTDCNHAFERGLKICPVCRVRYMHWRSEMCRECHLQENPDFLKAYEQGKEARRIEGNIRDRARRAKANPHPCMRRGKEQRCKRKPGLICPHNRRNALKCAYFKVRVAA